MCLRVLMSRSLTAKHADPRFRDACICIDCESAKASRDRKNAAVIEDRSRVDFSSPEHRSRDRSTPRMNRVMRFDRSLKLALVSIGALFLVSSLAACSSDDTTQQPAPATSSTSATEPPPGDQQGNGSGSGGSGTQPTSSDAGKADATFFPGKSDKPQ